LKTIRIGCPWVLVCSFLLLAALPGCAKKEPAESTTPETASEKTSETEIPTAAASTQPVDGLSFALKEVAVADIPKPKPMILNREGIASVLHGEVAIGGEELSAYVMDLPVRQEQSTQEKILYLYPKEHKPEDRPLYWRTNDPMQSYQQIGAVFYSCSIRDDLSAIVASPYQGDMATLRVGCAERTVKETRLGMCLLRTKDKSFTFAELSGNGCTVPVGDFISTYVTVDYDALRVSASNNRYQDAGQSGQDDIKTLQIDKGQTVTCDFSGKPKVVFTKITNGTEFKPGDEIDMATVLVDTKMNMMISRLYDTSQKETREIKDRDGNVLRSYDIDKALVPTVQITRADGTVVAEGQMPFG
jgi:hypothetical protein